LILSEQVLNSNKAMLLSEVVELCHIISKEKGFWPTDRNLGEAIALIHSELSEMLEALRSTEERSVPMSEKCPGLTLEAEEAADVFIRLADYCGGRCIDLEKAVRAKISYNINRPHRHGRQF